MNNKRKIVVLLVLLLQTFSIFAADAFYQDENYTINVKYNDTIIPGNAVFVRMQVSTNKNKKNKIEKKATLQLYEGKKIVESSPFYILNENKKQTFSDYLAGVPVSLWITTETRFTLKVVFSFEENQVKEFELPVNFELKDFNKETINLNEANTAIKTDNSPERAKQIEKLNNILFTTMTSDVFDLTPMKCPTTSTRYTAYCGDRRIYAYSNGKSSTSLHYGNDYGVPTGTEVYACAAGKVVMAENRISTGWSVVIEHLPGLYSLYYHLSEMEVKEGDMVTKGQLIAKSGATGLATGPHLHWEMRLNGSAVCPEFFLTDFTFENEN